MSRGLRCHQNFHLIRELACLKGLGDYHVKSYHLLVFQLTYWKWTSEALFLAWSCWNICANRKNIGPFILPVKWVELAQLFKWMGLKGWVLTNFSRILGVFATTTNGWPKHMNFDWIQAVGILSCLNRTWYVQHPVRQPFLFPLTLVFELSWFFLSILNKT